MVDHHAAPSAGTTHVLIADDHDMARAGICSLLSTVDGLQIIGEATDGHAAVKLCAELSPDLVLLDIRMPHQDGIATLQTIRRSWPSIRVVILTMHDNPDYLVEAIKAGAAGYILKDASRRDLIAAIRQVLRGETAMPTSLMSEALQRFAAPPAQAAQPATPLTRREVDVLRLIAQGQTNRQIGLSLSISPGTVKVHVERIIGKLEVYDRTQAAVRAIELSLV